METVEQRASNLASFWYGGGKPEEAEEDLRRKVGLAKMIEKALREQDKLTRHAIAEALAFHIKYSGDSFQFCPWCGERIAEEETEQRPEESWSISLE